jgi:hypothetical protein
MRVRRWFREADKVEFGEAVIIDSISLSLFQSNKPFSPFV